MLKELRQKLGVDIHWQKDKNGIIRGYGIVDHKTKTAFDGSQVLRMGEWMDIQTKRNEEKIQKSKERASESRREHVSSMPSGSTFGEAKGSKAQKSIGSSGQHIAINTDSITIAKHKNGKHYLRVIFNNFGHSEIFFLSKANGSNNSSPSNTCSKPWAGATTRTGNGKLEMDMMAIMEWG